ncbi:MAG TPA: thioesterase family protein [Gemmataceae bacterium]|jgi:YbgC/YbaW family acyl-CoA thioester hydrolase|nr:thioesterase family protein [Gemmataceae bacterium]
MTEPFRTTRRVEFVDTDMAGIAHFSNFFRWMEAAEVDFLLSRGLMVSLTWEGQRLSFPRVAASCDFLRPVRFQDILEITVRVLRIGRKSVTYGFEFAKGGETVAKGQISAVCCRIRGEDELESMEIPPGIRTLLEDR